MTPARRSWFEATARGRIAGLVDAASFGEFLPPTESRPSPHLEVLGLPGAFDDGIIIGRALLATRPVLVAAQEGQFMGGAVGEIHGAKLVGLLRRAVIEQPAAVLMLIDSGGVRLHEANAGLIAISEIMRAVLAARAAGVPVLALIGGNCGAFGGMGIVAKLCSTIVMSEEGRLALSGPEVIETVAGVEEFDAQDRALVWRVTGGKHRYLMDDCQILVDDEIAAFRQGAIDSLGAQHRLEARRHTFADCRDGLEVWARLGFDHPERIPLMRWDELVALKKGGV